MRKLLKYKLTDLGTIPNFIENGGYFPDGEYLYGITVSIDDEWTPAGTTWVSQGELQTLLDAINANLPDGQDEVTIESFESDKFMFRYRQTTPEARIAALEDFALELMLA